MDVTQFQKLAETGLPIAAFLATVGLGYILKKFLFKWLTQRAKHTRSKFDDIIIATIRVPFIIWFIMLGVFFALELIELSPNFEYIVNKILFVLAVFSIALVLSNISCRAIKVYARKFETIAMPVTSLTQNISRIVIFGMGTLIILNGLGISIAPILATLGVGGLAVALALNDTLSNLFAGFYIIMAKQVRVGDYIKLESGEEGYVSDITLRATKIRMLPNNVVLVPNEKLTKAIVTNYYLPDKEMAVLLNIGVHYNSDLKKVEKVTCETAREIMQKVTGAVPEFEPFIRFHTFGDYSIQFTLITRVKEFVDQYLVKHELVKRLHERYMQENIVIPYPIRAVNYEQEKNK